MGLIADVLGGLRPGAKPVQRTIADVEKALARLANERTAAREAVAKAMRRRDELLLVDDTDKKIAELDASADRCRLTLERCEKAEPLLLAELAALRTEAKQARWRDLRAKYATASRDYADVLRKAVERQGAMLALNDLARGEGFETEVMATFTPPMRLLSAEGLNEFERALDRLHDAEEAMRGLPSTGSGAPPRAPVTALPVKVKAPPPKAVAPAPPKPREPIIETPSKGEFAVVILRAGVEAKGKQWADGDQVALKPAEAERLMQSGAATLADGQQWSAAS